jgi:hypothetical protein
VERRIRRRAPVFHVEPSLSSGGALG